MSTLAVDRPRPRAPLIERLTSTDHKRIGLATVTTALVFFALAGLLALVLRSELAAPGMQVVSMDTYNQTFTMHGSTMFFLFAAPVVMGVGLYFVPLQIGASELLGRRAALFAYWLYLGGGIVMWSGWLTESGAADWAWFAFYPLSDSTNSPGTGGDFWIIGVAASQAAVAIWAGCLLATIVRRRAPGMTLMRMPLFTWSQVATVFMVITTFPVVVVAMALLYIDRNAVDVFSEAGGAITWQHLFWFYAHPLVYVVFFPLVGVVGEVIATFSRRRFFGQTVTVFSLLLFAAFSTSVWGHHMFVLQPGNAEFFSTFSHAIAVPAGVEYFAFIATMWGGCIRLGVPMLFALGFVLIFLIGGLTGVFVASPPLNAQVHDTYFVVAHFHYTLFGGTVFGLFAAIYYWFPKVTGRLLGEGLGRVHFALMFLGALGTFLPMFFLGADGMPRQVADYAPLQGWQPLNVVATVGAFTIFASLLAFVANVWRTLRGGGAAAGNDPWDGQTLEWTTSSPPPPDNFASLPPVRSYAPLLDLKLERRKQEA